eukprot:2156676-Karenia_brevis.AAC.1
MLAASIDAKVCDHDHNTSPHNTYMSPLKVASYNGGRIMGRSGYEALVDQFDHECVDVFGLQESGNKFECHAAKCGDYLRYASKSGPDGFA